MTELKKLNKEIDNLRQELLNPAGVPLNERKIKFNKLNELKAAKRLLLIDNKKAKKDNVAPITPSQPIVDSAFDNIDKSKYVKLYNKLNKEYLKNKCKLLSMDIYKTKDGKEGFFHEAYVIPEEVGKTSGIFVKLLQIKGDGKPSKKFIRKSPMDSRGFPLEDIIVK